MGTIVCTLFHSNWIPAQEIPTRKLVRPLMNKKPPIQSTRASLDLRDVFSVLRVTQAGTSRRPNAQKGN